MLSSDPSKKKKKPSPQPTAEAGQSNPRPGSKSSGSSAEQSPPAGVARPQGRAPSTTSSKGSAVDVRVPHPNAPPGSSRSVPGTPEPPDNRRQTSSVPPGPALVRQPTSQLQHSVSQQQHGPQQHGSQPALQGRPSTQGWQPGDGISSAYEDAHNPMPIDVQRPRLGIDINNFPRVPEEVVFNKMMSTILKRMDITPIGVSGFKVSSSAEHRRLLDALGGDTIHTVNAIMADRVTCDRSHRENNRAQQLYHQLRLHQSFIEWASASGHSCALIVNNMDARILRIQEVTLTAGMIQFFTEHIAVQKLHLRETRGAQPWIDNIHKLVYYVAGLHSSLHIDRATANVTHMYQSLTVQLLRHFEHKLELPEGLSSNDLQKLKHQVKPESHLFDTKIAFKTVLYAIGWWAHAHQTRQSIIIIIDGLNFLENSGDWMEFWNDFMGYVHESNTTLNMFGFLQLRCLLLHPVRTTMTIMPNRVEDELRINLIPQQ